MPRPVPPCLWSAALAAALALTPSPGRATGDRLLASGPPVILDGTGRVVGLAYPDNQEAVPVWVRIGGRELMLRATPDTLSPDPNASFGQLAFAEPGCAGAPWFVPPTIPVLFVQARGPGNALFVPDGPAEIISIASIWNPFEPVPCQAQPGGFVEIQRAMEIVPTDTFPPPYTVR